MGWNGYTNYSPAERGFRVFEKGSCENCGGDVEEPNAIFVMEPEAKMKSLGLKRYDGPRLPEVYWCDALDCCACEKCYVEEGA